MSLTKATYSLINGAPINVLDYGAVGDGVSDDTTAIQAAVTAASNNSLVYFPAGTYCVGTAGIDISSRTGLTLYGDGATIKITGVSVLITPSFGPCTIRFTSCTQSGVSGLTINGNSILSAAVGFSACTECFVDNCTIFNSGDGTGQVTSSNGGVRNRFTNNLVYAGNSTSRGLWLGNVTGNDMETDLFVSGNTVRDNPASGIVVSTFGGIVNQNYLYSNEGAGIVIPGYLGLATSDAVISNNYCEDNKFHGIQSDIIYATDDDLSSNITIIGNVCINHTRTTSSSGIYVVHTRNWAVIGNICKDNFSAGIYAGNRVLNTTFTGNVCLDTRAGISRTQSIGIALIADGASIENVVVNNNVCKNNLLRGIFATTTAPHTLTGLTINGNITPDNGTHGIFMAEAATGDLTKAVVVGNVCYNNATHDLRVSVRDVSIGYNRYSTQLNVEYYTFDDLDTSPSVVGRQFWRANNTGATSITAFDDGVDGQQITIRASTANTTIVNGATIVNKGGINVNIPSNGIISYVRQNAVWLEMSRSF